MKLLKQKMSTVQTDNRRWNSVCAPTICDMLNFDKLTFNKMEVIKRKK